MARSLLLVPLAACALLGACDAPEEAEPVESFDPVAVDAGAAAPETEAVAEEHGAPSTPLDASALEEREDPVKVILYFARAVGRGLWDDAALAWEDGTTSPAQLEEEFGGQLTSEITFGSGEIEGAAGSLYYEAPISWTANGGEARRDGTIRLHRINDVPGAEESKLVWHIQAIDWD